MDKAAFEHSLLEKILIEKDVAQYKKQYKIQLDKYKDKFIKYIKNTYGIAYSFIINKNNLPYPLYWLLPIWLQKNMGNLINGICRFLNKASHHITYGLYL